MKVLDAQAGRDLVRRRHPEHDEFANLWKRTQDSLEGGDRYRFASYGVDPRDGQRLLYNLTRHKKEYPPPRRTNETNALGDGDWQRLGADSFERAAEDSFKMRQARTPVPRMLHDAIQKHLSRIYSKPIHRTGPPDLVEFWADVDGLGNTIDEWLTEGVAELFLAIGHVDILFDHPAPPDGETIATDADVARLGLGRCYATVILPENVTWWRMGVGSKFAEVLVKEQQELREPKVESRGTEHRTQQSRWVFRHWDAEGSVLYDDQGNALSEVVPHPYRRVPIARIYDRRRMRCRSVGLSRYEGVLEAEREYYNEDSELILANTLQAHPTLQGPAQTFQQGNEIEVGPGGVLPIFSDAVAGVIPWSFVEPPKDAARFIQESKADLSERVDRMTCQTKPAGAARSGGGNTVAQSGVSKELDQRDGNDLLAKIARSLRKLEMTIAEYAQIVLTDGAYEPPQTEPAADDPGRVVVTYPGGFNLLAADELASVGAEIQTFLSGAGDLPTLEKELLAGIVREALPGLDPQVMDEIEEEIDAAVDAAAARRQQQRESTPDGSLVAIQAVDADSGVPAEGMRDRNGNANGRRNMVPEDAIQPMNPPSLVGTN